MHSERHNRIHQYLRSRLKKNGIAAGAIKVTLATGGDIITSPDLKKWTPPKLGTVARLTDVKFGNGRFLAVGSLGTILTSTDAVSWTDVTKVLHCFAVTYWGLTFPLGFSGRWREKFPRLPTG